MATAVLQARNVHHIYKRNLRTVCGYSVSKCLLFSLFAYSVWNTLLQNKTKILGQRSYQTQTHQTATLSTPSLAVWTVYKCRFIDAVSFTVLLKHEQYF